MKLLSQGIILFVLFLFSQNFSYAQSHQVRESARGWGYSEFMACNDAKNNGDRKVEQACRRYNINSRPQFISYVPHNCWCWEENHSGRVNCDVDVTARCSE